VSTPFLSIDVATLDRNIATMAAACETAGVALRPHAKGHQSAWIAQRQAAAGAVGVAAATAREALALARAGVRDILITSSLGAANVDVAVAASRFARVAVVAGSVDAVALLGDAEVPTLVDVDVGQRRGGAAGVEEARRVAEAIHAAPNLTLAGVQAYEGHVQGLRSLDERAAAHAAAMTTLDAVLAADGIPTEWVTSAGTATFALALERADLITELQPGSYALMDAAYGSYEDLPFVPALRVVTSVLAVLGPDEVIVDAGHRAVSIDMGPPQVVGLDAVWASAGDEHGRITGDLNGVRVGDTLELIPAHGDTTIPLYRGRAEVSGLSGVRG
jgi:D-serine deaminase-like pyridoxal phosphate-dependent protein